MMTDHDQHQRTPFGMGRQGYMILVIIILSTALFAATRRDWSSMLITALAFPVVMVALIHVLSRFRRNGPEVRGSRSRRWQDVDLLTFLARTNPLMFLLFGALNRGADDDRYQELLRSGPYGMGKYGYLFALAIVLSPLILALIMVAVTGRLPTHTSPHFP